MGCRITHCGLSQRAGTGKSSKSNPSCSTLRPSSLHVHAQALEIIRKKYKALTKFANEKLRKRMPKLTAESVSAELAVIEEFWRDSDGKLTDRTITYVTGWTLVPPNMMRGGINNFPPIDALDGAGFRGAARGMHLACVVKHPMHQTRPSYLIIGTLLLRGTIDANKNVHPVSVSHLLAAEGNLSVGAHIRAESALLSIGMYSNSLNDHRRVSCMDGGAALINMTQVSENPRQQYTHAIMRLVTHSCTNAYRTS